MDHFDLWLMYYLYSRRVWSIADSEKCIKIRAVEPKNILGNKPCFETKNGKIYKLIKMSIRFFRIFEIFGDSLTFLQCRIRWPALPVHIPTHRVLIDTYLPTNNVYISRTIFENTYQFTSKRITVSNFFPLGFCIKF